MLLHSRIYAYIRVYKIFKTMSKIVHYYGIQTSNLVHTSRRLSHYAASVNTSELLSYLIRIICNNLCTPSSRHLAAGVGHPARPPQRPSRLAVHLDSPGPDSEVLVLPAARQ